MKRFRDLNDRLAREAQARYVDGNPERTRLNRRMAALSFFLFVTFLAATRVDGRPGTFIGFLGLIVACYTLWLFIAKADVLAAPFPVGLPKPVLLIAGVLGVAAYATLVLIRLAAD